jgi:hypothetical protein
MDFHTLRGYPINAILINRSFDVGLLFFSLRMRMGRRCTGREFMKAQKKREVSAS